MSRVSRRVGVLTLSDASETTENNHTYIPTEGGNLDDKAPCVPKLLTGLCIGQMVMLVAAAATLGAVVSDNIKKTDDLNRRTQMTESFIRGMEPKWEVIQADVAKLKLQIDKGTSNSTNTNTASITNQSLSDLQQIEVRFDSLESTLDTYGAALSNIEGVTSVREELFQNYTYRTEETINELQVNLTAQGAKFIALNETIYETVTQLKARVKDLNNSSQTGISMLSQLEADMNSSKAIIQDHDLRIKELKTNRTAGRESIINLETEIANLEANLTSVSTIIKTQGEFLISMNETLIQMGAVNEQSSTSLKAYMERQLVQLEIEFKNRLLKIESNATTNRKDIEVKYLNITDKMTLLETNVLSQMGKSENLSSNLANLEFDIGTITATLHINHDDIVEINEKIRHLNDTLTDSFDMAQYLISNITYLELEIGAMKAEIQNNSHGIVSAVANFQELDKSTSDSISRLDTGLTDITDALNCTWSDWEPFSMCSKSCGGGTKYRTRRCESTMPLNQRWLQRTETDIQLCNSYTCSAIKSAFTVKEVADGPGGTTIFTKYITNIGGHYDTSTGRFTCQYSGIYLFSLNILKDESEPSAFCYISVNGELQAGATSNPRATGGYLGSSNTVIFHLYHGDVIELDICTSAKTMTKDNKTTFSGVLLQAD